MKHRILSGITLLLVILSGCQDEINNRIDELSERVSDLEEQVNELNSKTIPGIQNIIAAINEKVLVSDIVLNDDGSFTVTFSDKSVVTLANAKDDTPVIGATSVDGTFYWTVNGEMSKDAQGKPVPVSEATPQIRINDGVWQISYDNGKNWAEITGSVGDEQAEISIIDSPETDEVIIIIDNTVYKIDKETPFRLVFDINEDIHVEKGTTATIPFYVGGITPDDEFEMDVLTVSEGWEAEIHLYADTQTAKGSIIVTNVDGEKDGKVVVYVSNGRGKTDIKSLKFTNGIFSAVVDTKSVPAEGGEITVDVNSNISYDTFVFPGDEWLSIVEDDETKTLRHDVIKFKAEANGTSSYRVATIHLMNTQTGNASAEIDIIQYPSSEGVTDIYSISQMEDGSPVSLYSVAVLASTTCSGIISDGRVILYVTGQELPVGKTIDLEGIKYTINDNNTPVVNVNSFSVVSEETEVKAPAFNYLILNLQEGAVGRTMTSGLLTKDNDGCYVVKAPWNVNIFLEHPLSDLDLESKVGSYVSLTGYTTVMEWIERTTFYSQNCSMIVESLKEIDMTRNSNWTLSYSFDKSDPVYPDVITNTVTNGDNSRYFVAYMDWEEAESTYEITDSASLEENILLFVDDLQYYIYYMYANNGYTPDEAIDILTSRGTSSTNFTEEPYGKCYAIAVGVDDMGLANGDYQYLEFEKKSTFKKAEYEDFLGEWMMDNTTLTVTEDVSGESYKVTGFNYQDETAATVTAKFVDGTFVMEEQITDGIFTNQAYGSAVVYFTGFFNYGGTIYPAYPVNMDTPSVIFTGYLDEDGSIFAKSGECDYGSFSQMAIYMITEKNIKFKGTPVNIGTMTRPDNSVRSSNSSAGEFPKLDSSEQIKTNFHKYGTNRRNARIQPEIR